MIKKPELLDVVVQGTEDESDMLPTAETWLTMDRRERFDAIEGIFSQNDRHEAALKICDIAGKVDAKLESILGPTSVAASLGKQMGGTVVGGNEQTGYLVHETMVTTTVTWGAEKFSPVQYNTTDIGPFSMEVTASESEIEAKMAAAYAKLEDFAEKVKLNKLASFKATIKGMK